MGTKSTTKIYENGKLMLALYKQYDGYLQGWGQNLKDFLKSRTFVNGLGSDEKQFNGIGDFALQLILEFKKGAGDLYATTEDDEQEFNYRINYKDAKKKEKNDIITITCDCDYAYEGMADFDEEIKVPRRYEKW